LSIFPTLNAEPMPETENYSLPLQQVARVVTSQPEALTPDEIFVISNVMNYNGIREAYRGELSDPIKFLWRENATDLQKSAFFRTWLAITVKHPATCLSATFHNTYAYFLPGYVSTGNLKPTFLIGKQGKTFGIDEVFHFSVNPMATTLKAFTDDIMHLPILRVINAPGLYGWIALFAVFSLLFSSRKELLIAALPALFVLLGCLLSAVNGYFRYALPLYICAPLLLALCAGALKTKRNPIQAL